MDLFTFDAHMRQQGYSMLAGVDEAGRGPLAGPVYAAAVILPSGIAIEGLNDSKKLTEKRRNILYDIILTQALAVSIEQVDHFGVDEYNILGATMLAMKQAVESLELPADYVLIDGNTAPSLTVAHTTIVGGDGKSASIAAASILAKVARDRYMVALDHKYPAYQFARHKGYPTALHYEMLDTYGPSPVHRQSFLKKWRAKHEKES